MNKKSKLYLGLVLLLAMALIVGVGCGKGPDAGGAAAPGGDGTPAPSGDSTKQIVMKVGHAASPESQRQKALVELAKRLDEETDGVLKMEIYPANQLGTNPTVLQSVQAGTVEGILVPTLYVSGFHNLYNVLDLPFLFPSADACLEIMEGEIGQDLLATVESKGMKGLGFWVQWTNIVVSDFKATSPEAFKGKKFRTMPSDLVMDRFRSWGASPINMDLSELYNGLQQGVVSGSELTFTEIFDFKLYESVKYLNLVNSSTLNEVLLVNKAWFDKLPADIQTVLQKESVKVAEYRLSTEKEGMDRRWEELKKIGKNEIIELTDDERAAFEASVGDIVDGYFKQVPEAKEFYDRIKKALETM